MHGEKYRLISDENDSGVEQIDGAEKERVRALFEGAGAIRTGFAAAGDVDPEVNASLKKWLSNGHHASMDWMVRHAPLRLNTDSVMPGAATVIVCAFNYSQPDTRPSYAPRISAYALGKDYHDVLRARLKPVCSQLESEYGGHTRICIDSAPVEERYFALKAGVGKRGRNGCVIVPEAGCHTFLAEILTDLVIAPDNSSTTSCRECGACIRACPTGALSCDGTIDSRRCLSYLSIEHRGQFSKEERELLRKGAVLFGCDRCLSVCPEGAQATITTIDEFKALPQTITLTEREAAEMSDEDFHEKFHHTPLWRAKAEGLRRNALALLHDDK